MQNLLPLADCSSTVASTDICPSHERPIHVPFRTTPKSLPPHQPIPIHITIVINLVVYHFAILREHPAYFYPPCDKLEYSRPPSGPNPALTGYTAPLYRPTINTRLSISVPYVYVSTHYYMSLLPSPLRPSFPLTLRIRDDIMMAFCPLFPFRLLLFLPEWSLLSLYFVVSRMHFPLLYIV